MGRYGVFMDREHLMGEGTYSICRRGLDLTTGNEVAVKIHKPHTASDGASLRKFRRQIEVLRELMEPLKPPSDIELWSDRLARTDPKNLFMQLIDYSKDETGEPGPDQTDGTLYVITELAQCSLRDYIRGRRECGRKMSQETVRNITKAILLVVAGLHAKGLVHLDIKPENLMIFDGVLKLIDVDGCVQIGSTASINDDSLSFSPLYCSPEWAALASEITHELTITPALDVWSVGMTLCDLVVYKPVLSVRFASFYTKDTSGRDAVRGFMDWLHFVKTPPIPPAVKAFDAEMHDMLQQCLLVLDPSEREPLTECLEHTYVRTAHVDPRANTSPLSRDVDAGWEDFRLEAVSHRYIKKPSSLRDVEGAIHRGILWRLEPGVEEDKWASCNCLLARNGSLCVVNDEGEETVILTGGQLMASVVSLFDDEDEEVPRPTIRIQVMRTTGGDAAVEADDPDSSAVNHKRLTMTTESSLFGCESPQDREEWMLALDLAQRLTLQSMKLNKATPP